MGRSSSLVVRLALGAMVAGLTGVAGYSLKGSREKMVRQNTVAHEDRFSFAQTPEDIQRLVSAGELVTFPGSADYTTKGVSFAFARPQVLSFVDRLGSEYRATCGQPLVITSLVRPISLQPRNASPLSVHPAGMAVDLHVPDDVACRSWLVDRLVKLASLHVLDVTEERRPHHFHVAVFPRAYTLWASKQPPVRVAEAEAAEPDAPRAARRYRDGPAAPFPPGYEMDAGGVATTLALMLGIVAVSRPMARRSRRKWSAAGRRR